MNMATLSKKKLALIFFFLLSISSCMKSKIIVDFLGNKKTKGATSFNAQITNIQIINNQLNISGTNLEDIENVKITGDGGFEEEFVIESKSGNSLVANPLQSFAFLTNQALSLVVSNAYGQSSFSITVNPADNSVGTPQLQNDSVTTAKIQDGAVTAAKLNDMGAGIGQILKYNGTNWIASDLTGLTYAGNWDANTNTPDLTGGGSAGEYRIVNVAGTTNLAGGPGTNSWAIGDWVVWNSLDTRWEKIDNATNVQSFNGRSGAVSPLTNDYTWAQIDKTTSPIGDLSNVDVTGAVAESILKFDGANWIVGTDVNTNTNAGTLCNPGEYLDGDGTCQTAASGDITGVTAGTGLSGGGAAGDVTLNVDAGTGANQIVQLDGSSRLPAVDGSQLTNVVGTDNTKLPLDGSSAMTGSLDMGAQNITNVGTVDGVDVSVLNTAVSSLSTDDVSEGANLYFTDTRARTAAVVDSTAGSETNQAPSVAAMKSYVTANAGTGDFLANGTVAMTGDLDFGNNKAKFKSDNANYVELISPAGLAATYVLTFPADDGITGQYLQTDGNGVLS